MRKQFENNKVRAAVFLSIIATIVISCNHFIGFADASRSNIAFEEFYSKQDNTIDSIYFGSSVTQRAFVVPVAFHEYGLTSYSLACGTQPFVLTKYLMQEALKTQSPKLFIVELKGTCKNADDLWDAGVRRVIDNIKPSRTRIEAIKAITEYAKTGDNDIDTTGMSYYFPILKYHNRWNPSKQPNYFNNIYYYNGYSLDAGLSFKIRKRHTLEYSDKTIPIDPGMEKALRDLLDYCDTLTDTEVLFVAAPYESSELGMGKINYSQSIVEERGYKCLNFLPIEKREELGLKDNTSYYNKEHLNYYGSLKYTDYLTNYIMSNYDVSDRRNDEGSVSWQKEYDRLMHNLETIHADDYNKMLKKIEKAESKP